MTTKPEPRIWIDEACPRCNGEGREPDARETICHMCQGRGFETRRITLTALLTLLTERRLALLTDTADKTAGEDSQP